ncbi:MAG TPA: GNAT family protein [Thermomicrobiaceae bacterium]|nr:GNAT family protein [Thermomicrobiaceae bacterium]
MSQPNEPRRDRHLSGAPVTLSLPRPRPERRDHAGRLSRLEPLDPARHAAELYAASYNVPGAERLWDYLPYGPFPSLDAFSTWLDGRAASDDPLFFAIRDLASGRALGMASYLRIEPAQAVIEIGHIWFAPALQRTPAATEAIKLLLHHALDELGFRRMEWKCDALNAGSRRAATRFGFSFEGIFYQHVVVKGHNRDTAWFSILDHEWPALRAGFARWLAPENFDADGRQRRSLGELTWPGERA